MIRLEKNVIYTIGEILSLFGENVVFSPKYAHMSITCGKYKESGVCNINDILDFKVTGCPKLQNHLNYIDSGYGAADSAVTFRIRGCGTVVKIAYRYKKKELFCELPYVPGYMECHNRFHEGDAYNPNIPGQLTLNFNEVLTL
jgi:hypothetical protein